MNGKITTNRNTNEINTSQITILRINARNVPVPPNAVERDCRTRLVQ